MHHINKVKKKNHMVNSVDAGKAFHNSDMLIKVEQTERRRGVLQSDK